MARIPEQELETIKTQVSVQALVGSWGIELKASGKDLIGRCPFHEDSTASLVVTPQKNLWHCFGCGAAGGPVDWVMRTRGLSFRHAVEVLKENTPVQNTPSHHTASQHAAPADCAAPASVSSLAASGGGASLLKRATIKMLTPVVQQATEDRAVLNQVAQYYHATLKQSPQALEYLQSRGIEGQAAQAAIDTFQLGYANRTLGLRLPEKNRKAGAQVRSQLERLGVYRDSGHEHLNGSLVIPLFNEHGEVVNLYGRKITDGLRLGTPLHLYLAGARQGLFNRAALAPNVSEEIIVCEALIDALTFWCAGYKNVTSAYGVEGITDALITALAASKAKRILLAFDRDEAGDRGANKLAALVQSKGLEAWRIVFPKGMDANEYAGKVKPASKSLGLLIRQAQWIGNGQAPARKELPFSELTQGFANRARLEEQFAIANGDLELNDGVVVSSLAAGVSVVPSLAAKEKGEPENTPPQTIDSPLPAAAMPAAAQADVDAQITEREIVLSFGEGASARRWRVRGLPKNLAVGALKVNVMVSDGEGRFHVDTLDLYAARARSVFVAQAAGELSQAEPLLKTDLGRVLLKLEVLQDEAIAAAMTPPAPLVPVMSETAQREALALLKSPRLLDAILADFEACGVVGESTNKLVGYLACVSRLLDRPLAVVIQSSSAAGKSSLMDAVLAFVPEEARTKYSAMTGQSLFYMGQTSLKHRILAIAEEEGASRASYAMKLLQSEGELTIASTGSDPKTGNLITQEYKVEGPTMLMMTTTAIDLDEELMNRCLVLTVDEEREQTRRIHALQREKRTLAGLTKREAKTALQTKHQNAQRLLKALPVVNPFADTLTFLDDRTRTRRDHDKYLTLIDTLALLHQHQRSIKTVPIQTSEGIKTIDYVEASLDDVKQANHIAHEILGISLDELAPQTRRLLGGLHQLVAQRQQAQGGLRSDVRFTRLQVRAHMGLSDTQCRVHLDRLVALEHVLVHRGQRGQSYEYELLHDGPLQEGKAHLAGLIDVDSLQNKTGNTNKNANENVTKNATENTSDAATTTTSSRGQQAGFAGSSRPENGPVAGATRSPLTSASLEPLGLAASFTKPAPENASDKAVQAPVVPYLNTPLPVAVSSLAAGVGVSLAA